jgi:hypothetical protein
VDSSGFRRIPVNPAGIIGASRSTGGRVFFFFFG